MSRSSLISGATALVVGLAVGYMIGPGPGAPDTSSVSPPLPPAPEDQAIAIVGWEWCDRLAELGIEGRDTQEQDDQAREILLELLHDESIEDLGFESLYERGYGWGDVTEWAPC